MALEVFQIDDSSFLTPYDYERTRLSGSGIELVEGFCTTEAEVVDKAASSDVLWLSWKPPITRSLLAALPRVRLVMRWGVGYDQIDLEAATDLGVAVANAPTYGSEDVAEHALALLLSTARRLVPFHEDMRRGGWSTPSPGTIRRLHGRTLGLVGVGRIGAALARRAAGLGLHVLGYDPARSPEQLAAEGVEAVDLDALLARSDFLSLHVPLTPGTERLVDAEFLGRMKPQAVLINTSRGRVIDQAALRDALADGRLAGAGLDVFEQEPLPADDPVRSLDNVVLTPHYAGYSDDSWADLRAEMCQATLEFLAEGWTASIVNPAVRERLRPVTG